MSTVISNELPKAEWPKLMKNGVHTYGARDQKDFDAHAKLGWHAEQPFAKFPMAVHGPNGTGKTVHGEDELAAAKAEGFSETPISTEGEAQ